MSTTLQKNTSLKKIAVTGATGFVGKKLVLELLKNPSYQVVVLSRDPNKAKAELCLPCDYEKWDPNESLVTDSLNDIDAVIHLAGESVAGGRWTEKRKKKIYESRINGTKSLVNFFSQKAHKPQCLISASAIGIYGDRGDEILSEESAAGRGFLAHVCQDWREK